MPDNPLSFDLYHPKPLLLVVSGPAGVGKDVTINLLRKRLLDLQFVVTTTSRAKRPTEVDGKDYNFVTQERFEEMIANQELVEYALVYGQYKGVPKKQIEDAFTAGKDVIMRIDVQGVAKIKTLYPQAITIFLLPESEAELFRRLSERHTETSESLHLRMETARQELQRITEYKYLVVNSQGKLEETVLTIRAIIDAEHHRVSQQKSISA
jgi:guanylate kinase